ncbi:MAG: serine hydrolase domain-containing protein [Bacteroidales bacterium]
MRCRALIIFPVLCFISCLSGQPDHRRFIDKEIRRTMHEQHLPAMAVTVVCGQEVLYQEAMGMIDLEHQVPATSRSLFKLWSLAKPFTALGIFREIREGRVETDVPITTYLPDFSIQSIYAENTIPTVRDLLAHRAGLPRNEGLLPVGLERDINYLERFECATSTCYAAYPVGTRYKYSNLGYDLLGRVLEATSHEGFFRYMKVNILNELGMQNADFYSGAIDSSLHRAMGYAYHKRKYTPYVQYDINNFPSGNLYATIEDLSAFLQTVFREDLFEDGGILSRMLVNHYSRPGDPETMGLGWKLTPFGNGETLVWHDGGPSEGIGSLVAFLPEHELGIAVIGNGTSFSGYYSLQFAMKILGGLVKKESGEKPEEFSKFARYDLPSDKFRSLEGSYAAFGSMAEVKLKRNHLKALIGGISLSLIPLNDTEFAVTHWTEKIGLTKIIEPPIDFTKIRVSFRDDEIVGFGTMILDMMGISYELCPRYPVEEGNHEQWRSLCGFYRQADRISTGTWDNVSDGRTSIRMEEGVLIMSGLYGPIVPVNDTLIRVLSGPFQGEFLQYEPESGTILHQKQAFIPINP